MNLSEHFAKTNEVFSDFMSQCEQQKTGIVGFQTPDLEKLFSTKISQSRGLLFDVTSSPALERCQKSGAELISACEIDLEAVEDELKKAEKRVDTLVLDLHEIATTNEKSAADLCQFNGEVSQVEESMDQLRKEMATASSQVATKALPALQEVHVVVQTLPERLAECQRLAESLGGCDAAGVTAGELTRLESGYRALDEQVVVRLREVDERVAEMKDFESQLARMDEKLTSIQQILDAKQGRDG